ncbi:hypothetical protein DdX_05174 [Ditylenchus destructor]|uniref:Uncharacterized protein n=1 Tax=Ditylenchus destructor TaxID=166010 RepID=A0AAD4R7F2_9BILA|nr:hypothetical protein DdX_05174 [Ditylenchus destructor]
MRFKAPFSFVKSANDQLSILFLGFYLWQPLSPVIGSVVNAETTAAPTASTETSSSAASTTLLPVVAVPIAAQ